MKKSLIFLGLFAIAFVFIIKAKWFKSDNQKEAVQTEIDIVKEKVLVGKSKYEFIINNTDSCALGYEAVDMSPGFGFSSIGVLNDSTIVIADSYFFNIKVYRLKNDQIEPVVCQNNLHGVSIGEIFVNDGFIFLLSGHTLQISVFDFNLNFINSINTGIKGNLIMPHFVNYNNVWYAGIRGEQNNEYVLYSINKLEKQFSVILRDDAYFNEYLTVDNMWDDHIKKPLVNIYGVFRFDEPLPYLTACSGTNYAFHNNKLFVVDDAKCEEGKYELIVYHFE